MLSSTVFAVQFSDLSKEHWAYEPIIEMANRGILNGYPNGTFLPDSSITRAEFAKILVLALNLKADKTEIEFQDVSKNDWSYQYIQSASKYLSAYRDNQNNLVYMPNNKAVREDIAVAIVIASGHENDKYSLKTLDKFSDKEEISTNLRKYVAIAVENGLMSGHANGTFEPKGYLTRAQVSKLMRNIEESKNKIVINEEDNNTTPEKEYFTDISFDSKTLKLDLGEDWDKYQFCDKKHGTYIYVPSQRYLEYQTDPVSYEKDSETGKTISNTYAYFRGNSKMTLKIMLKENSKKYTLIQLNNPFYISKFTNEAYTENGNKYIKVVVNATNDLVKAEYQIDDESWKEDTNVISGKKASFIIDVTKFEEGKSYKVVVRLTDKYGNVDKKSDYFEIVPVLDAIIDDENKEFDKSSENDEIVKNDKVVESDKVIESDKTVENDKVVEVTGNDKFDKAAENCMNWLNTYKNSFTYGSIVKIPPYKGEFGEPNSSQMDSSGYVSWVIHEYGKANGIEALEKVGRWSTTNFKVLGNAIMSGEDYQGVAKYFEIVATRADMPGGKIEKVADRLQAGDIILYAEGSVRHIEILKETGSTKVYSCGSASGWIKPGTQSYTRRNDVTYIFRLKK